MKRMTFLIVGCLLMVLYTSTSFAQLSEDVSNRISVVVDDFDGNTASQWTIRGSRFAGVADVANNNTALRSVVVDAWPETLYGYQPSETRRSLGIEGGFRKRGNNFIEIIPPGEAIQIPGVVESIEMWMWNDNRDYYVEAHFRDYRGFTSVVHVGDLYHRGWNKISARIPRWVPQQYNLGEIGALELTKLVVWTKPNSRVDKFYIYLDELRVITDTFRDRYDGEQLARPEFIEEVWG